MPMNRRLRVATLNPIQQGLKLRTAIVVVERIIAGCNAKSNTTRIETRYVPYACQLSAGMVATLNPIQQGLKHTKTAAHAALALILLQR